MIFKQSAMVAILFFHNEAKIFYRHVFIAINILCKFGEDIFINDQDIKIYVKMRRTDAHKAFYNIPTMAFGHWQEVKMFILESLVIK